MLMDLIDRLFKGHIASAAIEILGCWHLIRTVENAAEPAEMDFRDDGRLLYAILSDSRWQIMNLVYQVEGDVLVTDQPSSPRKERTRFAFEKDGTLMLEFGGQRSWFKRGPKVAPEV